MKARKIFLAIAVAAFLGSVNVMAQDTTPADKKQCSAEQLVEKRIERLQTRLSMDDATAAKFAPIYKEYLKELKGYHPTNCPFKGKELTDDQRIERLEMSFEMREKILDTQKKYFNEFKEILNARQLEMLFAPHAKYAHHGKAARMNHCKQHTNCDAKAVNCHKNAKADCCEKDAQCQQGAKADCCK